MANSENELIAIRIDDLTHAIAWIACEAALTIASDATCTTDMVSDSLKRNKCWWEVAEMRVREIKERYAVPMPSPISKASEVRG